MVLLSTEKYQKELMTIMKQIKKLNLKSQVRAELEEVHLSIRTFGKLHAGLTRQSIFRT